MSKLKQKKKTQKKTPQAWIEVAFLIIVVCLSFVLKYWLTQNNHFLFWFDQARDSIVSQQMISTHHLKIQGPSASGTQDTVYHGVIWFYFLAPLYAVFQGNPQGVVRILALLTSLAIIPYYFFVKEFSRSRYVAALASLLIAFSPDSITNSTWIANPVIAYCSIPIFYFSVWKTFFERRYRWLILATFMLGLLQQSLIFLGYFWIVILAGYFYDWQQQHKNRLSLQLIVISLFTYLLTISTMILTQLKLMLSGIYPMLGSVHSDLVEKSTFGTIQGILTLYFEKMRWIVLPQFPVFSVCMLLLAIFITWKNVDSARKYFIATWLFAPLMFLLFLFRDAIHTILGTEWMFVFCLAFAVVKITQKIGLKYIFATFFVLLFVGQIFVIHTMRKNEESFVGTQQGAWVDQQLALIDKTYALAAGQPFSISTYTNPYGYNTTWAYLYSWYGQKKYGYTPVFYGPDQKNLFGDSLLVSAHAPLSTHFVIIEPIIGVPEIIYDTFMSEQNAKSATPSAIFKFGSIQLQERVTSVSPQFAVHPLDR